MLSFLLFLATACLVVFGTIPALIKFSASANIYAKKDNRTIHREDVSNLGGVAIFFGVMISLLFLLPNQDFSQIQYLLLAQFIMFFIGLKDDIFLLSSGTKLMAQIGCALLLIFLSGTKIDNFYSVLGIHALDPITSVVFSVLLIIGIINSFNLIDGINCLAALVAISCCSFLAIWFGTNGFIAEMGISAGIIGALIGFLYFNRTPARIFMGDSGSLFLGVSIAFLFIQFINYNHTKIDLLFSLRSAPSIAVSLIFIPLLDTLRIFFVRALSGKNPLSPDRNHLHHILIDKGMGHGKAALILFAINTMAIVVSLMLHQFTGRVTVPLLFLCGHALIVLIGFERLKKRASNNLAPVSL